MFAKLDHGKMNIDDKLIKSLREDSVDESVIQEELNQTASLVHSSQPVDK